MIEGALNALEASAFGLTSVFAGRVFQFYTPFSGDRLIRASVPTLYYCLTF